MNKSRGKSFRSIHAEDRASKQTNPSPLNFDQFVPWLCAQWCASTAVVVTRLTQEKYVRYEQNKPKSQHKLSRKSKVVGASALKSVPQAQDSLDNIKQPYSSTQTNSALSFKEFSKVVHDNIIQVLAYYDEKSQLVEIAIVGCTNNISRRVIQAFNICVPYHYMLNKLSLRKGGLNSEVIYEIDKLLPLSNITELCFDDTYVKEGNYYILLEQYTQLQRLSLNRCVINDDICTRIFKSLDCGAPAAKTLQILELGSNIITDIGAAFVGTVLKANRCLLHLNLSGNRITDKGFRAIATSLMEFPLSSDDIMALRARRLKYLRNKTAVYERYLNEIKYGGDSTGTSGTKTNTLSTKRMRKSSKKNLAGRSLTLDNIETLTRAITGDFDDPYAPEHVVTKNGIIYSKGNMILCSLNMAYNDLHYPSVKWLYEVICYQIDVEKRIPDTGLLRVILDGNCIPSSCWELHEINAHLSTNIHRRLPVSRKNTTSSILRKMLPG